MSATTAVTTIKGGDQFIAAECVSISPQPKLGGDAGPLLRFLNVSRGQSIITDLEQGSLARKHRVTGMPLMHRMWFHHQGYSLGYTKKQKIGNPSELYFRGPDAKLRGACDLPDAVSEIASGQGQWYVGCRNGTLYAFSLDGSHLWRQIIPCRPVDTLSLTAAFTGADTSAFLRVEGGLGGVVVAESDTFYAFDSFGQRWATFSVPQTAGTTPGAQPDEIPTREAMLRRLGFAADPHAAKVRTAWPWIQTGTPAG